MKHFNKLLFTALFSFLVYSAGYSQNFSLNQAHTGSTSPDSPNDMVIVHYDGDNAGNSVGDGGTTFIGGARFRAEILGAYAGGTLQAVQFHYTQAATGLTIMIYDAGTATDPGTLLLSQPLDLGSLTVGDWNEIALTTNIPVSGNDLWVCLQVEDSTSAAYPLGVDAGPADPDGDYVNDSGTWQHLNDFGLNYNWNIRGVVETSTGGGTVIFSDDFDSYTAGQQLACQNPTDWTTWSQDPCNATEDAYISSNWAHSGANSFVVAPDNDEVHYWGPETSGKWEIDFYNYIPTGKTGYFNALAQFIAAQEWGLEVYFNASAAGSLNAGGNLAATFTYSYDTWVLNQVIVDLDNDLAEYWYNGTMVYSWQWTLGASGTPISNMLAADDFFGAAATDEMYVDDYQVMQLTAPTGIETSTTSPETFNLAQNYPNPFNPTTTITYSVPQAGKIKLAVYNLLGQEVAVLVNGEVNAGMHQAEFNAKSLPSGAYFYRLQSESSVSVKKMLLLK